MANRRESRYDALKRQLRKLEKEHENTSELAVVKRAKIEAKATKIEAELDKMRKE